MRSYFVGNQPLIDETAFRNRQLAASRVFHSRGAGFGAGLWANVRV
jgi:hypothetical protein